MRDVSLRGTGNHWNDVVTPGFDYLVIENTLGEFGKNVETLTKLPNQVRLLVGNVAEWSSDAPRRVHADDHVHDLTAVEDYRRGRIHLHVGRGEPRAAFETG